MDCSMFAIYDITEIPYEFKLLFRGSRDGFSGKDFHKLCDNIPGTVVIVKINSTAEILGGYILLNGNLPSIHSDLYDIESYGPWFSTDLAMNISKI
ncbi:hypothetical protein C2G38_2239977 [Gigaspora rosea]|uniref:TLDc domain-containing protein n=1 Tax=Gigaspora rosea TaxID=44941 RepID=A0A397W0W5_9GLOM|nr:hypothetical protein C2G38_2239977 [Gigaspora rosea]